MAVKAAGTSDVALLTYDNFDRLSQKVLEKAKSTGAVKVEDTSIYTYEPQLDTTRLLTANNGVENLSFNFEAQPPFDSVGYGVYATDTNNPLHLIEDNYIVLRDVTGNIAGITNGSSQSVVAESYDPAGRLSRLR